jgi:hypothetical protein
VGREGSSSVYGRGISEGSSRISSLTCCVICCFSWLMYASCCSAVGAAPDMAVGGA